MRFPFVSHRQVGSDNVAKIADFGISKFVQGSHQRLQEQVLSTLALDEAYSTLGLLAVEIIRQCLETRDIVVCTFEAGGSWYRRDVELDETAFPA